MKALEHVGDEIVSALCALISAAFFMGRQRAALAVRPIPSPTVPAGTVEEPAAAASS